VQRFTGIEKILLAVAAVCICVGILSLVHPVEQIVAHSGIRSYTRFPAWTEYISKGMARIYGALAILVGVGMIWLVFFRGKKE
jgi:hypothetical protein